MTDQARLERIKTVQTRCLDRMVTLAGYLSELREMERELLARKPENVIEFELQGQAPEWLRRMGVSY